MSRLYESSTDYEEHITYSGVPADVDYDNPQYSYDRPLAGYDGDTQDLDQGYASTSITYSAGVTGYNGSRTLDTTATGSGTGTSTATGLHKQLRTATGSGTGTSLNAIVHEQLRTATGSGGATTGDTATGLHTQIRTATGSGAGGSSATGLHKHLRTATGSGAGTQTGTGVRVQLRAATGAGTGTQTAAGLHKQLRTATGAGTGTQTTIGVHKQLRSGTGTGTGADIAASFTKSLIFRPPAEADFAWAPYHGNSPANRLFSRLTPGASRLNVYKLSDGTYTSVDPRNDNLVVKTYFGGHNNFVTAEEKADLVAAGYEVT